MNYELSHHGIKGQRWGIRRFQNKDGSLTTDEKKRVAKLQNDYEELTGKKFSSKKESGESSEKKLSDLTDDEIRNRTNRMRAEKDYLDVQKQLSSLQPQHVSAGKRFINHIGGKVIAPALTDAGKRLLTDMINKKGAKLLGIDNEDTMEGLRKQAEELKLKRQIDQAKEYFKDKQPKKTPVKNLIGNIDDLTDQQIKEMISRLDNEEQLRKKLASS